jgi:hypothetical protein
MDNYKTSRNSRDYTNHPGNVVHTDSKRASNDDGPASPADNHRIQVGNDGLEVALVQDYDDKVFTNISWFAQNASTGASLDRPNDFSDVAFLSGGLAFQSTEDLRVAFAIRGASRVLTHQLVRTRAAAFKQQSQRDCWYGVGPEFRMPESVWMNPVVRTEWIAALRLAHVAYNLAITSDVPYEDARYILPEGTTNFIFCEYSLRTFMETYAYRACVMFQSEMVAVWRAMRALLVQAHPYLEDHIKISCEIVKKCTFQGEEPTAGTCSFPWARTERKTIPLQESK